MILHLGKYYVEIFVLSFFQSLILYNIILDISLQNEHYILKICKKRRLKTFVVLDVATRNAVNQSATRISEHREPITIQSGRV